MNDDWADFELAGVAEFADYIGGGVWVPTAQPKPEVSLEIKPEPEHAPVEDWHRVGEYARWALARIGNGEDPRHIEDFKTHLGNLGADFQQPQLYGWPSSDSPDGRLAEAKEHILTAASLIEHTLDARSDQT